MGVGVELAFGGTHGGGGYGVWATARFLRTSAAIFLSKYMFILGHGIIVDSFGCRSPASQT